MAPGPVNRAIDDWTCSRNTRQMMTCPPSAKERVRRGRRRNRPMAPGLSDPPPTPLQTPHPHPHPYPHRPHGTCGAVHPSAPPPPPPARPPMPLSTSYRRRPIGGRCGGLPTGPACAHCGRPLCASLHTDAVQNFGAAFTFRFCCRGTALLLRSFAVALARAVGGWVGSLPEGGGLRAQPASYRVRGGGAAGGGGDGNRRSLE